VTVDQVRTALRERITRGASLEELDTLVGMARGIGERQRAALWSEAWRHDPRRATLRRMDGVRSLLGRVSGRASRRTRSAAARTLRTGARAAPAIDRFLRAATPFMPQLGSVLGQLAPMVGCLRPYGPEIAGQIVDWAGFQGNYDQFGHYQRAAQQKPPFAPGTPLTSVQIVNGLFRNHIFYAMPRPPGLGAGQPWLIPECGAGADALDVTEDPELGGAK
jgi:hypothetical protein